MAKSDTVLSLARDRMQEQSNARNRLTTKTSIAFSALGILATIKLPDLPMGLWAYGSLFGLYTCTLGSAYFFFKTLNVKSYRLTPVPYFWASRYQKMDDEELNLHTSRRMGRAFRHNRTNVNSMAKSFSIGFIFLMGVLLFRAIIQFIDYVTVAC